MARNRRGAQPRPRRESGVGRALQEFLALPLLMVCGFLVMAALAGALDRTGAPWLEPARRALSVLVPPGENQSMLRTVAPGMLTLMTITFFLLLTLVQRMADVFTWVVVEQFLMNRVNQACFGYFAGLSAYFVVVLAVVAPKQAVFSTITALVLSVLALVGLVIFGYVILDQLRPASVVEHIVASTLATRATQLARLRRFRDAPLATDLPATTVRAQCAGYLVDVDFEALARGATATRGAVEIEIRAAVGSHLVAGSDLAVVRATDASDRERLADVVLDALRCGRERQLPRDPVFGVHQLSSIGWAAATQQDPEAALVAVDGLHSLLAEWLGGRGDVEGPDAGGGQVPVVYRDTAISEVLSSLANVAVAAGRGGQQQTSAAILQVFASTLPHLSREHQRICVTQVRATLPAAATTHSLTVDLDRALDDLRRALSDAGHPDVVSELSPAMVST